jgi:hypothetical protein
MTDPILTDPFAGSVRLRSLWPPGYSLSRLVLAIVPVAAAPDLPGRLGLDEAELYRDDGAPCLVLGECGMTPDDSPAGYTYVPRRNYTAAEVVQWTRMFSSPQKAAERAAAEQAESRRALEQAEQAKAAAWLRAETARVEADRLRRRLRPALESTR